MKNLKKLSTTLAVLGLCAPSIFAEIKLNDNFSVSGFLDASATYDDVSEAFTASFDQLEVDFHLNYGPITARADINSVGSDMVLFEQGYASYAANGAALSIGRFLSVSGWEAAEPTGLYQYSISKTTPVYGGYQNGLALSYATDMFGLYGSVVSGVWSSADTDMNTPGFEVQGSLMPVPGLTAKVAYLFEVVDTTGHDQQSLLNAWASYATGPVTVAGEYNFLMDWEGNDNTGHGWIGMVNVAFLEKAGATLRYSGLLMDDGDPDTEVTISPSYAISDNWLVLAEVKREIDAEVTSFAFESLFSF